MKLPNELELLRRFVQNDHGPDGLQGTVAEAKRLLSGTRVNRLEVIDHRKNSSEPGRSLVVWEGTNSSFRVTEQLQDGGRTLKIFLD